MVGTAGEAFRMQSGSQVSEPALEKTPLSRWVKWEGIESQIAQMANKLVGSVCAIDLLRRYAAHGFDKLVEVRMIG